MSELTFVVDLNNASALAAAQFTLELGRLCQTFGASFSITESASSAVAAQPVAAPDIEPEEPTTSLPQAPVAMVERDEWSQRVVSQSVAPEVPAAVTVSDARSVLVEAHGNRRSVAPSDLPVLQVESKEAQWARERGLLRGRVKEHLNGHGTEAVLDGIEAGSIPEDLSPEVAELAKNLRGIATKLGNVDDGRATSQPASIDKTSGEGRSRRRNGRGSELRRELVLSLARARDCGFAEARATIKELGEGEALRGLLDGVENGHRAQLTASIEALLAHTSQQVPAAAGYVLPSSLQQLWADQLWDELVVCLSSNGDLSRAQAQQTVSALQEGEDIDVSAYPGALEILAEIEVATEQHAAEPVAVTATSDQQ
jgi:hypothetical protein